MKFSSKRLSYSDAVETISLLPENAELIRLSYLDADPSQALRRFVESEEFRDLLELLELQIKPNKLILDVGSGNGIAAFGFAALGHQVVSLEPESTERTGLKAQRSLKATSQACPMLCQATAESLPFADSTFDLVYARQALHHFRDLQQGVAECARVLRPGGTFFASREHVVSSDEELKEFLEHHPLHKLHQGEFAYSEAEYIKAITLGGLGVELVMGPFDSVINHFPVSNNELRSWLTIGLVRRFGKQTGRLLSRLSLFETYYRKKLSRECCTPGRLYSFLCSKPLAQCL